MRRLYVRLAREFGWTDRQIDRMTVTAANWFVEELNEERPASVAEPVDDTPKGPLTEEEFARIEGQMRAFAEADKQRSPWA